MFLLVGLVSGVRYVHIVSVLCGAFSNFSVLSASWRTSLLWHRNILARLIYVSSEGKNVNRLAIFLYTTFSLTEFETFNVVSLLLCFFWFYYLRLEVIWLHATQSTGYMRYFVFVKGFRYSFVTIKFDGWLRIGTTQKIIYILTYFSFKVSFFKKNKFLSLSQKEQK